MLKDNLNSHSWFSLGFEFLTNIVMVLLLFSKITISKYFLSYEVSMYKIFLLFNVYPPFGKQNIPHQKPLICGKKFTKMQINFQTLFRHTLKLKPTNSLYNMNINKISSFIKKLYYNVGNVIFSFSLLMLCKAKVSFHHKN
jgi:hypothetical protein